MPRGKKEYQNGDQMHFIVTEDFREVANLFKKYCEANSINTSGAIRDAITQWLNERTAKDAFIKQMESGNSLKVLADMYEREVLKEG